MCVNLVSCNKSKNIDEVLEIEKLPLFGTSKERSLRIIWMGFWGIIIQRFEVYHPAVVKVVIPDRGNSMCKGRKAFLKDCMMCRGKRSTLGLLEYKGVGQQGGKKIDMAQIM